MDYTIDQLMDDKAYKKLCDVLINMVDDSDTKSKLEKILYEGKYDNFSLKSNIRCKDNPRIEATRRISMAYLLVDSKEIFDYFYQNNINCFHGTNSNALPNILKYGVSSVDEQKRNGLSVSTGEEWSRVNGGRSFTSFTDVLDTALNYSSFKSDEKDTSFEVIICTSSDELKKSGIVPVWSDISEIGVKNTLDVNSIKVICVPSERVEYVKRLVKDRNIKVMGFSGINKRFYGSDFSYYLEYYPSLFEEYKNNTSRKCIFSNDEVRSVASSRSLSRISNVLNKIKSFIKGDYSDEHTR